MQDRFDSNLERIVAKEFERVGLETGSFPEVLPGRPDFVIRGANIAVFVHGCYWHRHFNCDLSRRSGGALSPRAEKLNQSVIRDNQIRQELRVAGWSVAVLWECSIQRDLRAVVADLKSRVENHVFDEMTSSPWLFVA
jgi:DNA mismatch endonuclease (patch repair protein)